MIALILATIWVWDRPVEMSKAPDAVWQQYICRYRIGDVYHGCFPYGAAGHIDPTACKAYWWERAAIDFPGEEYVCSLIRPAEADLPISVKP